MGMKLTHKLDTKALEQWPENVKQLLSRGIRKIAFDIEAAAKAAAPVDTGAMKASIYTSMADESKYAQALSAARAANPRAALMTEEKPTEPLQAFVVVGVAYGYWVEIGTSRRPATPFLGPALEAQRTVFSKVVGYCLEQAAKGREGDPESEAGG